MILRKNSAFQASFPPFLKRRKASPRGISASMRTNHVSTFMFHAVGRGSSHTYTNCPRFMDLERQISTLSFFPNGPSLPDLLRISKGSLSQLASPWAWLRWPHLCWDSPPPGLGCSLNSRAEVDWGGSSQKPMSHPGDFQDGASVPFSTVRHVFKSPLIQLSGVLQGWRCFWWHAHIHRGTEAHTIQILHSSVSSRTSQPFKNSWGCINAPPGLGCRH